MIQLDSLAEFIINTSIKMQSDKVDNITDVFFAADLDGNGTLDYQETKLLANLLIS